MTRLASVAKAGFYPTPESVTPLIAQYVTSSTADGPTGMLRKRLLDPCCGKGIAAHDLAKAWNLEGYGIELDAKRAKDAGTQLRHVLNLDYQHARIPLGSIQVLFVNPPYSDAEGEAKRLEYEFLRGCTRWLQPGGVLVYLVPQYRVDGRMANYLASAYERLAAFRFPDPEYAAFKQCVIFGVAKERMVKDDEMAKSLLAVCREELAVLEPPVVNPYVIPAPDPKAHFYFRGDQLVAADLIDEAQQFGAFTTTRWRDLTENDEQSFQFRPVVPFKKGHLASLIAAGLMRNLRLKKGDAELLVKGRTRKIQVVTNVEQRDGEPDKLTVRDQFVTEIVILNLKTGTFEVISEVAALSKFIEEWRATLAAKVAESYQPLYTFDLAAEGLKVNALLDSLSKGRVVPGRKETGLFNAQRHTVVALWKRLHTAKYALCVGEPGVGKTTISTSVAALRREIDGSRKPTLVLCPPHLVGKWKREIEEIIPGAEAHLLRVVTDVDRLVERANEHPEIPMFGVVSREMAKLGNRWHGAPLLKKSYRRPDRRRKVTTEEFFICPHCGAPQCEQDKNGEDLGLVTGMEFFDERKRACIRCREPLYQEVPIKPTASPRAAIAKYIARHYHHAFGLFICDEAHQMKGQSTDQGYALGALIRACDKTLALTGTIYGGRSTSLFYLLHRFSSRIRDEFEWSDGQRWAERYGVIETKGDFTSREGDQGFGVFSGKLRHVTSVREMPGVSPELVIQLLDAAVFLGLPDLGFTLPGYVEIAHEIEMTKEMREAYDHAESSGIAAARAISREKDGDKSVLPKVIQALLGWPNMPSRADLVYSQRGDLIADLPALKSHRLFPKEDWLVNECLAQKERGRKTIVFCRQTGTRDITAHIEGFLKADGLRVAVLRQSVSADQREAWLARTAPNIDVLIVNPKIVDTGLDLVQFQTIVWLECEYSLYVLMQATKRIYRVGQVNDVEIHFAVYKNSLEHRAVALAGQKWSAAQLLYGDTVEGALAQQGDADGSFLAELTRSIIAKTKIVGLSELYRGASKRPALPPRTEKPHAVSTPSPEEPSQVLVPVAAVVSPNGWVQPSLL